MYTRPPDSSSFNWMAAFSLFIFFSKVDTQVSYGTHSGNLRNRTCNSVKTQIRVLLFTTHCFLHLGSTIGFMPFEINKIAYIDKIILSFILCSTFHFINHLGMVSKHSEVMHMYTE